VGKAQRDTAFFERGPHCQTPLKTMPLDDNTALAFELRPLRFESAVAAPLCRRTPKNAPLTIWTAGGKARRDTRFRTVGKSGVALRFAAAVPKSVHWQSLIQNPIATKTPMPVPKRPKAPAPVRSENGGSRPRVGSKTPSGVTCFIETHQSKNYAFLFFSSGAAVGISGHE